MTTNNDLHIVPSSTAKGSATRARRDFWFQRYLDLGGERSLRKLSTTSVQNGNGKTPSFSTLGKWSADDHWDNRAKQYDAQISAEVAEKRKSEIVDGRIRREDERLEIAQNLKTIVRSAIVRGHGQVRDFVEFDPKEWSAIVNLFKQVEHTEL